MIELSKLLVYFHFRSVKLHYAHVEETHMMLVAFFAFVKFVTASQHRKDNERNLCQDLLTIQTPTRPWKCTSCTMQMSYLYASDFPFKNFCKLAKQAETIRNHQNRFWLWLSIVWETHKLTRYQSREFWNWSLVSTLKNSPFPLAQGIKLHIRALVLIPCLIPCHRREKSARESRHSHHLIKQRDNIHARAPDMCVDPRGYMTSGWRDLF